MKALTDAYALKLEAQARELSALRGKKYAKKDSVTLAEARASFMKSYTGRDRDWTLAVAGDLDRFVEHFGASTKIDALEGREQEINAWLRGLKTPKGKVIGPSRRMQIRLYTLKLLGGAGLLLDKGRIDRVSKAELRKARGPIRWLTLEQAKAVAERLPATYSDAWRIQVGIGLRPDELLTLCATNFSPDFSSLTLEPLGGLTLKTGSRIVPVPSDLRPLVRLRAACGGVLFPEPTGRPETHRKRIGHRRVPATGGEPYRNPKKFSNAYRLALVAAADEARINIRMDARIGRRTCASLLIQANVSAEKVAALLGNSAAMVISHYGAPDTRNLDLTATSLTETKSDLKKKNVS